MDTTHGNHAVEFQEHITEIEKDEPLNELIVDNEWLELPLKFPAYV